MKWKDSFCLSFRICEFWQPSQRPGSYPGYEWLSDWHEKTQSAAQEAKGCKSSILSEDWQEEKQI